MQNDILSILNESEGLNAKVFSLVRLKLLASLAAPGPDGATYRELRAALDINDGVLFANLNVLKDMGYLTSEKITSEGKNSNSILSRPKDRMNGSEQEPGCPGSSTAVHEVWKNGKK